MGDPIFSCAKRIECSAPVNTQVSTTGGADLLDLPPERLQLRDPLRQLSQVTVEKLVDVVAGLVGLLLQSDQCAYFGL